MPHEISGKTVVELGPGSSLSIAVNCLLDGAEKVFMVDKYPRFSKDVIQKQYQYFKRKKGFDKVKGEVSHLGSGKLRLVKNGVENMKDVRSQSVDIIISNSVLEHVRKVETTFGEMYRILNKEGIMYHKVDMRDHYNFKKPLEFLKYSEDLWENLLTKEGYSYTNRLRKDDYVNLLKKYSFNYEIIDQEKIPKKRIKDTRLSKKFQRKRPKDLRAMQCVIIARKQ
ncbi:hypothetical protein AKJ54_00370 [candidate division MSBL1 archaeon SCGC-AAA382K21]|uniref:Methyltransferase type 11 domain-containing protein n=1 Tax=candidate division MSBL1 archaeon SCGC-AAA382K21 TaxID=1698283 RepID=A0A133VLR4_9EURY|nr:hypothetical protein AKJ54_00370 [candidate division MSBL1 archaeon SCGC-AAA382K21]